MNIAIASRISSNSASPNSSIAGVGGLMAAEASNPRLAMMCLRIDNPSPAVFSYLINGNQP